MNKKPHRMSINLLTTLSESIDWVNENKTKPAGCICPCCGQLAKTYKRKLHTSMALTLINMYKYDQQDEEGWIFVKDFLRLNKLKNSHDWTLLRYWGILEEKPKSKDQKTKTSGYWRITKKGYLFVTNQIYVQKHIYIFDTKLLAFSDEETTVVEALGNKFNYEELMQEKGI